MTSKEHFLWQDNICKMLRELKEEGYPVSDICKEYKHKPNNIPKGFRLLWFMNHMQCVILNDKDERIICLRAKFDVSCRLINTSFGFEVGNCKRDDELLRSFYKVLYFPYRQIDLLDSYVVIKNEIRQYFDDCLFGFEGSESFRFLLERSEQDLEEYAGDSLW